MPLTILFYQLHFTYTTLPKLFLSYSIKMDFKWLSCRCWKHHYFKSLNKMLYTNLFDGCHFETDDYIILNFLHHTNYEYINIMNHTYVFFQYWLWNLIIVKTHTEIDQKPKQDRTGRNRKFCLLVPNPTIFWNSIWLFPKSLYICRYIF